MEKDKRIEELKNEEYWLETIEYQLAIGEIMASAELEIMIQECKKRISDLKTQGFPDSAIAILSQFHIEIWPEKGIYKHKSNIEDIVRMAIEYGESLAREGAVKAVEEMIPYVETDQMASSSTILMVTKVAEDTLKAVIEKIQSLNKES